MDSIKRLAGVVRAVPELSDAFARVAQAITRQVDELIRMERGHLCGPRDLPDSITGQPVTFRRTAQQLEHRRRWRACKRYWTQAKHDRLPRGERA